MTDKKNLVLIDGEMMLSPLLKEFLTPQDLKFTLIVNDILDYSIPYDQDNPSDVVWFRQELVELAKAIIPKDKIGKSPFFRSMPKTHLELTKEEEFLINWMSETESVDKLFKIINENFGKNFTVLSSIFPEKNIQIKGSDQQIPLRYFQITGFFDFEGEQKADLNELQEQLAESEGKKKEKLVELISFDTRRPVFSDFIKKEIEQALGVLWFVSDPCTLAIMALNEEIRKSIKDSKAPVALIFQTRDKTKFTFREQFLLSLLGIEPSYLGLIGKLEGIVDHLVIDAENIIDLDALREKGFNIIIEEQNKGRKSIATILKGIGMSIDDISIGKDEREKKKGKSIDELVTQLSVHPKEVQEEIRKLVTEETDEKSISDTEDVKIENGASSLIELSDTEEELVKATNGQSQVDVEELEHLAQLWVEDQKPDDEPDTTTGDSTSSESKTLEEKPKEEKPDIASFTEETFTKAFQNLLNPEIDEKDELIDNLSAAISKNSEMGIYAAKKLTHSLENYTNLPNLFEIYLKFATKKPLIFINELGEWITKDISDLDFLGLEERSGIILEINKLDNDNGNIVEGFLELMVDAHVNKAFSPRERERLRTFIGIITARNVSLQRSAIRHYLTNYDKIKGVRPPELWLGLIKFDATLVVSELIELSSEVAQEFVNDILTRDLGSYAHIIYDVYNAYTKGDLQRVLNVAGTLSDTLMRKTDRVELAEKIKKYGSISVEALAKRVEKAPEELEQLVYEMIEANELNVRIEVVEGRMTIVYSKEEEKKENNLA